MKDLAALEAFTHYLLNTNTKFVEPPSGLWNRVFSDWKGWSILNLSPCLDVTLKKSHANSCSTLAATVVRSLGRPALPLWGTSLCQEVLS